MHQRRHVNVRMLWLTSLLMSLGCPAAANTQDGDLAEDEERIVLLREGTRLVEARGAITRQAENGRLVLRTPSSDRAGAGVSELILLPSTRRTQVEQIMQSLETDQATFRVTGMVYLYLGRNYLVVHQAIQANPGGTVAQPANGASQDDSATTDPVAASRQRETDDIIADLERSFGPVGSTQRDTSVPAANNAAAPAYQEGRMIVQRRARPIMTEDGRWRLVFDADAAGFADPPVLLLPCRLLEQIQRLGQRDASERALRITGEIYTDQGTAYLMPLSYHVAHDRSRLGG